MARLAPPPLPPSVAMNDGDGLQALRLRLWLIWAALSTIVVTTWLVTLGPIPGILGLVVAKHVLVAILVMGLGINAGPGD